MIPLKPPLPSSLALYMVFLGDTGCARGELKEPSSINKVGSVYVSCCSNTRSIRDKA